MTGRYNTVSEPDRAVALRHGGYVSVPLGSEGPDWRRLQKPGSATPMVRQFRTSPTEATSDRGFWDEAEVNEVMRRVLVGCKRYLDYVGHYIAFLLGQTSEDEFEKISTQYVAQPWIPDCDLLKTLRALHHTTGSLFSSDEVAAILFVPREQVEAALTQVHKRTRLARSDGS